MLGAVGAALVAGEALYEAAACDLQELQKTTRHPAGSCGEVKLNVLHDFLLNSPTN
jgi:hypothetical protein